jgi:hypothetical protein
MAASASRVNSLTAPVPRTTGRPCAASRPLWSQGTCGHWRPARRGWSGGKHGLEGELDQVGVVGVHRPVHLRAVVDGGDQRRRFGVRTGATAHQADQRAGRGQPRFGVIGRQRRVERGGPSDRLDGRVVPAEAGPQAPAGCCQVPGPAAAGVPEAATPAAGPRPPRLRPAPTGLGTPRPRPARPSRHRPPGTGVGPGRDWLPPAGTGHRARAPWPWRCGPAGRRSATRRRSRTGTGTPCRRGRHGCAAGRLPAPGGCRWRVRRRRAGVLGGLVPGLAAEEERPQMRVVEAEGQWDGLAQVAERLVAGELELTPDLPAIGWRVEAAEDADVERVGRWRDRRSGGGHLRDSRDEWPVRVNLPQDDARAVVIFRLDRSRPASVSSQQGWQLPTGNWFSSRRRRAGPRWP